MQPRDEWHLQTKHIGQRVLHFPCLESTNTYASTLAADPANAGVVVLADEQTAGRGQLGRTWTCPAGDGVLMSVLLFPPLGLRRAAILTAWAAVSVCETIREVTGAEARVKWPNDILMEGRKVCGVLIEQAAGSVVAGIGLNVSQSPASLSEAGLTQAASLAMCVDKPLNRSEIARHLIKQLDEEYDRLRNCDFGGLETRWKEGIGLIGKSVTVDGLDQTVDGSLRDLTFSEVVVDLPDGHVYRARPEVIRHIHLQS
jgi:BirA family biotin operon repressor/biotin-[acetyl-CoA-carboxylase] ligase